MVSGNGFTVMILVLVQPADVVNVMVLVPVVVGDAVNTPVVASIVPTAVDALLHVPANDGDNE
jgi:hypothetical protein